MSNPNSLREERERQPPVLLSPLVDCSHARLSLSCSPSRKIGSSAKMASVHKEHGQIGRGGKGLNASLTSTVVQDKNSHILHEVARRIAMDKRINEWAADEIEERDIEKKKKKMRRKTFAADVKIQEWAEEIIGKKKIEEWLEGDIERKKKIKEWAAEGIEEMPCFWKDLGPEWTEPYMVLGDVNIEQSPTSQSSEASLDAADLFKMELEPEVVLSPGPPSPTVSEVFYRLCDEPYFNDVEHAKKFDELVEDPCSSNEKHDWPLPGPKKEKDELVEDLHSSGRDEEIGLKEEYDELVD